MYFFIFLKGSQYQTQQQPVLVSASAGDPSADWDLIDVDEEEDEEGGDNKAFVENAENRLIGRKFNFLIHFTF
jgi:hypothetical protein